jgi:mannose/cellobiose epimerase-like protein (N-acyl-D-glucosamine 2-epimerase family)
MLLILPHRRYSAHHRWLEAESDRLLGFSRAFRRPTLGYAWLDGAGQPQLDRPVELWITCRMTHVFALGQLTGRPGCAPLVDHGVRALAGPFHDLAHGGWYAAVSADGPVSRHKNAYEHGMVVEQWDETFEELDRYRGANATCIPWRRCGPPPMRPVTDGCWTTRPTARRTCYGPTARRSTTGWRGRGRPCTCAGPGRDGAVMAARRRGDGRPVVRERMHWVAAEATATAAALSRATGEPSYEEWYRRWWDHIATVFIDDRCGSWHHELDPTNRPGGRVWQGKRETYHAMGATLVPRLPLAPTMAAAFRDRVLA